MKSYTIDTTMITFASWKKVFDDKVTLYKTDKKKYSTGVIQYYDSNGVLSKTEYTYMFSEEDKKT